MNRYIKESNPPAMRVVATGDAPRRDDRLDMFRGIALLLIFIDHVEWLNGMDLVSRYTLSSLGFCDAAEVFVFISGYVCAFKYWPVIAQSGFLICQIKAFIRVRQLWFANFVTLLIVLNFVSLCYDPLGSDFARYRIDGFDDPLTWQIPRILLQVYQPAIFDVLTLYMHLLLVLPVFLIGISRYPRLTWLIVVGMYVAVQFLPWLNYPVYDSYSGRVSSTPRTFNHLAWQFLFFLGCMSGMRRMNGRRYRIPRSIISICFIIIILIAYSRYHISNIDTSYGSVKGVIQQSIQAIIRSPLARRPTEGPIRIVYFCMLAAVAASTVPERLNLQARRVFGVLICCSNNSLIIFCVGILLTYASHPIFIASLRSQFAILGCETFGCGAMILTGILLCRLRTRLRGREFHSKNTNSDVRILAKDPTE
jgi:hypothetical protein